MAASIQFQDLQSAWDQMAASLSSASRLICICLSASLSDTADQVCLLHYFEGRRDCADRVRNPYQGP